MEKVKKWFNSNIPVICITLFLMSVILSCFNLFKGLHNITLTFIILIMLSLGYIIMIYDIRKNR